MVGRVTYKVAEIKLLNPACDPSSSLVPQTIGNCNRARVRITAVPERLDYVRYSAGRSR